MPAVTRELSIVYGTRTVGGAATDVLLHGPVSIEVGPDRALVAFECVVRAATEAAFDTLVTAVETDFRTPRQRLRIIQGAATLHDWNPTAGASGNTGFLQVPTLDKMGDEIGDTGRSRLYRCSIEIALPADTYAQSGRRNARVIVDYDESRIQTLSVVGEWTAITTVEARAQYRTNLLTYVATIQTALGGTWEQIDEQHDEDETNKTLRFRHISRRIVYNQASGALNHAAIVNPAFNVTVTRSRPGDSPAGNARRLLTIHVAYSTSVDVDVSTDLEGLYTGTIRPWLLDAARDRADVGSAALIEEAPAYDGPGNRIGVALTLLAPDGGSAVLEYTETTEINDPDLGTVFIPAWTGTQYEGYMYQGVAVRMKTVTKAKRVMGGGDGGGGDSGFVGGGNMGIMAGGVGAIFGASFGGGGDSGFVGGGNMGVMEGGVGEIFGAAFGGGGGGGGGGSAGGGNWIPVSRGHKEIPLRLGTDDNFLDVLDTVDVETWRWFAAISAPKLQTITNEANGGAL